MKITSMGTALMMAVQLFSQVAGSAETLPGIEPGFEQPPRAVEVKFFGGIAGYDAGAYRLVRAGVAALIAEGVIDQFVTKSWGREGGSEFCVELSPRPDLDVERITGMLSAVKPGNNTVYSYQAILNCSLK